MAAGEHGATLRAVRLGEARGELRGAVLRRVGVEGAQIEGPAEERPGEGQVGGDERGGGFADVPEGPHGAEWFVEGVVFV